MRQLGRTLLAHRIYATGCAPIVWPEPPRDRQRGRTRSVAIRTGNSPLIRTPAGPCSSASVFTTPASPGIGHLRWRDPAAVRVPTKPARRRETRPSHPEDSLSRCPTLPPGRALGGRLRGTRFRKQHATRRRLCSQHSRSGFPLRLRAPRLFDHRPLSRPR